MMHLPIAERGRYLARVLNGFFNYFAVPTNSRAINSFYRHVGWYWFRALRRRSQNNWLRWQRMRRWIDLFCRRHASGIPIPTSRSTLRPEARARCGSSARRDLSGRRRAIAVPTATFSLHVSGLFNQPDRDAETVGATVKPGSECI